MNFTALVSCLCSLTLQVIMEKVTSLLVEYFYFGNRKLLVSTL